MEKQRDIKILTIVALIIAIICLLFSIWTVSIAKKQKENPNYKPEFPMNTTTTRSTNNSKITTTQSEKQESIWSVHFENLSLPFLHGTTKVESGFKLKNNSTIIDGLNVTFLSPKDYVKYTFDVINQGNVDSKISNIVKASPICSSSVGDIEDEKYVCDNIKYTLTYTSNGKEVKKDDILDSKEKVNLTLKIEYSGNKLPADIVKINGLSISLIYVQK